MTYKEKKLKEFEKSFFGHKSAFGQSTLIPKEGAKDFLSSTIDEILGCLPDKRVIPEIRHTTGGIQNLPSTSFGESLYAWNECRSKFLQNLEDKVGEEKKG